MKNDFKFCPNCASKNITNTNNRKWECGNCGFVLYNNSATADFCLWQTGVFPPV
ncbi:MAG: transposase [Alphaproteobacteria bacterium]|nr:transposase [Alphaproteobacteria bacterium]